MEGKRLACAFLANCLFVSVSVSVSSSLGGKVKLLKFMSSCPHRNGDLCEGEHIAEDRLIMRGAAEPYLCSQT